MAVGHEARVGATPPPATTPVPAELTEERVRLLEHEVPGDAPPTDPLTGPLRRLRHARELIGAGDGEGALKSLGDDGVATLPVRAHVELTRTDALLLARKEAEALAALEAALASDPPPAIELVLLEKEFYLAPGQGRGEEVPIRIAARLPNLPAGTDELVTLSLAVADDLAERGRKAEAFDLYHFIAVAHPTSAESSDAEEQLSALAGELKRQDMSGPDRLGRAHAFYVAGRFRSLKNELAALRKVDGYTPPAAEADWLAKAWGRALLSTGDMAGALGALKSYEAEAATHPDAVLDLARIADKRGESNRATALREAILSSAQAGEPDERRAVREAVGSEKALDAEGAERIAAAATIYLELARLVPESRRCDEWLYRGAFLTALAGDRVAALAAFEREVAAFPDSSVTPMALFWMGRLAEEAGDSAAAARDYRAARDRDPHSFYGRIAAARVGGAAAPSTSPMDTSALAAWRSGSLVHGARARAALLLSAAGLDQPALAEAEELARTDGDDPAVQVLLARSHRRLGHNLKARGILLGGQRGIDDLAKESLPAEIWDIVYPLDHVAILKQAAKREGVPLSLLLGLVFQESMFEPEATSRSGAMGLMQLMPATAGDLARKLGIAGFRTARAYEPELNVAMGASYLADLIRRFDESWERALAGYNGGPTRSQRFWARLPRQDALLFVESIPVKETRLYVKKVLDAKAEYERIHGPF